MATIRYTLDGSDPSPTHGFIYTGPFTVPLGITTVKAITYGDGLEPSEITEVIYTIEEEEPEPEEPATDGECASSLCLTPTEATPTCILPLAPTIVCLTPTPATVQCGNDRLEDECPEGSTGEPLFIAANTYFANSTEAANVLAQAALDALRAASPCVWENEEQECCNNCPEGTTGDPICVTIEAGDPRFTSTVSQEAANAAAMAQACADAAALRELTPCVEDEEEQEPGSLWGWGYNATGVLGMGDLTPRYTPDRVGVVDELTWTQIDGSTTNSHTVGLKEDGSIYTWGTTFFGEMAHGVTATTAGSPYNIPFPTQVGSSAYKYVAAGSNCTFAIKTDGTLWSCGRGNSGRTGHGDTTSRNTLTQIGSASDWVFVTSSGGATHAINEAGEVWAWGLTPHLTIDLGVEEFSPILIPGTSGFKQRASTGIDQKFIGVKLDGTLWEFTSWYLSPDQLGSDEDWVSVSGLYALKEDGTLWKYDGSSMTQFGSDSDWAKVIDKGDSIMGLKVDGTLWAWGFNFWGEHGQGSTSGSELTTPVQIGPDGLWVNFGKGNLSAFGMRSVTTEPPPPATATGIAEGGSIILAGGYAIHRFDYDHPFEVVNGAGKTFEWMLVGGGGEGGGLGGGSGAEITLGSGSLADGQYPVVIGGGGIHPLPQFELPDLQGDDGGTTTFNGDSALGGVGGGGFGVNKDGKNGTYGAGGGSAAPEGSGNGSGGTGTFNGGNGSSTSAQGRAGGGGAGSAANGNNASSTSTTGTGGAGGAGTLSSFGGISTRYCAGGGGGAGAGVTTTPGNGGNSVGGVGGRTAGGLIPGGPGQTPGSGGGGGTGSLPFDAGPGARGVVFVRYLYP